MTLRDSQPLLGSSHNASAQCEREYCVTSMLSVMEMNNSLFVKWGTGINLIPGNTLKRLRNEDL